MGKTIGLFLIAALAEIGGAYLIWQWARAGKPIYLALLGVTALFLYGMAQTLQEFNFGRAFAAYGGVFITVAIVWGWLVDRNLPDRWDLIGVGICLVGVALLSLSIYSTRSHLYVYSVIA